MPIVNRQNPKHTTTQSRTPTSSVSIPNVLDRIIPVTLAEGLKFCVYGRGKTGKTRLACTFPKPALIIGTEDGTKSVIGRPGIDFVQIRQSGELTELVKALRNDLKSVWIPNGTGWAKLPTRTGHPYKTVCQDTAGGLQDLILKEVLNLEEIPVQKTWGLTDRQTWGTIGIQFKERMRELLDLSDLKKMSVVVIAHERNFDDESKDGELLNPVVGAALTKSAATWLNGAVDYICQTFIRDKEISKTSTVRGPDGKQKPVIITQKTGKPEFCLRTGPHAMYITGFRLPEANILPDLIVDPSYEKILKIIKGEKL